MPELGRRARRVLLAAGVALALTGCGRAQDPTTVAGTTAAPSIVSTIAGGTEVLGPAAQGPVGGAATDASTAATGSSPVAGTPVGACEKAQFVAHAGLASGAVHRYLWEPYQQGAFDSGAQGRQQAVAEAALAATLALRQVAAALRDIEGCPDLQALASAIRGGVATIGGVATGLGIGSVDAGVLTALNDKLAAVHRQAAAAGITVPDLYPTLTELATSGR